MLSFNLKMAKEFWGAKDVEWRNLDSIIASGGLVILWRKDSLELINSFKGLGFLGLKALQKGSCINFINVYAPCNTVLRREVWKNI